MKRAALILTFAALLIIFAGCEPPDSTPHFTGVILEMTGDSVLAAAAEENAICASGDLISFSVAELPDIGAKIGDTVRVECMGDVMTSYPAQVIATGWSLVK